MPQSRNGCAATRGMVLLDRSSISPNDGGNDLYMVPALLDGLTSRFCECGAVDPPVDGRRDFCTFCDGPVGDKERANEAGGRIPGLVRTFAAGLGAEDCEGEAIGG
jgi:hypothetical protein